MLKKGAFCTDIHFGKRGNSEQHNQDCLDYLDWFCVQAKKNNVDYIAVLGDWNENRTAINLDTLKYSYTGAKKLNDLGVPVYFCVGNHDCMHKHSRDVHSIIPFAEFSNFVVIDTPQVRSEIMNSILFCPYLFHDEYPSLVDYHDIPTWAGHFEFKGFKVTGTGAVMQSGPDHTLFDGPKHILSGHFHKRQIQNNVVYIGNTFPMDFSDAGDNERGMMIYDNSKLNYKFINWSECPKFIKTSLSKLLDGEVTLTDNCRVACIADIPLTYEESVHIRQKFLKTYKLREFSLEESNDIQEAITDTEIDINVDEQDIHLDTIDELVVQMLNSVKVDSIDNNLLIHQYENIVI